MKAFETEIPEGYVEKLHINATDKKTGLIFNGIAFLVLIAVLAVVIPTSNGSLSNMISENVMFLALACVVIGGGLTVYMVLHELVHGLAYKLLTKQKLTFGMTWSCAFCGVPNVFVYRKTALIALTAPLITFTVVLLPALIFAGVYGSWLYIPLGIIFGMHLGGCSGDAYLTWLLLTRFRSGETLVRDTGPEQFIYQKEE
ncbi:MAG: DUF3267 domain-containing protein [Clostridia bacterium]|nr:DUF3267 domain-containing protein [Clostridia bacterium]